MVMAEYLNNFFGFIFKLFKKDSNNKASTLQRSNSVREKYISKRENKNAEDLLFHDTLKRNKSCPAINTTNSQSTKEEKNFKASQDNLHLKYSNINTASIKNSPALEIITLQSSGEAQRFLIPSDMLTIKDSNGNIASWNSNPAIKIVNLKNAGHCLKTPLNELNIEDSIRNTASENNPSIDRINSPSSDKTHHFKVSLDNNPSKDTTKNIALENKSSPSTVTNLQNISKSSLDKFSLKQLVEDTALGSGESIEPDGFLQGFVPEIKAELPWKRIPSSLLQEKAQQSAVDKEAGGPLTSAPRKQHSPFRLGDQTFSRKSPLWLNLEMNSDQETECAAELKNFWNLNNSASSETFTSSNRDGANEDKWKKQYDDLEDMVHELQCSCSVCRNFRSAEEGQFKKTKSDFNVKENVSDPWRIPFPEYPSLESLASSSDSTQKQDICEEQSSRVYSREAQKVKPDYKSLSIFTTKNLSQSNNFCKSKIPVPQSQRISNVRKIFCDVQTSWKKGTRTNLLDWSNRHSRYSNKNKTRKSYSTTSIVERSVLNFKFDRMFRKFSKKIYRGNIIDPNSHSKWMKLAGIFEEEDASSFKNYAKLKVVLTLSEYKEALSCMCKNQDKDYWEILRLMTNVKIRGEGSSLEGNDERFIESKEDLRINLDYAR